MWLIWGHWREGLQSWLIHSPSLLGGRTCAAPLHSLKRHIVSKQEGGGYKKTSSFLSWVAKTCTILGAHIAMAPLCYVYATDPMELSITFTRLLNGKCAYLQNNAMPNTIFRKQEKIVTP